MHIDFDRIEENLIHSPRGGQGTFGMRQYATRDNRVFKGRLLPGSYCIRLNRYSPEVALRNRP